MKTDVEMHASLLGSGTFDAGQLSLDRRLDAAQLWFDLMILKHRVTAQQGGSPPRLPEAGVVSTPDKEETTITHAAICRLKLAFGRNSAFQISRELFMLGCSLCVRSSASHVTPATCTSDCLGTCAMLSTGWILLTLGIIVLLD